MSIQSADRMTSDEHRRLDELNAEWREINRELKRREDEGEMQKNEVIPKQGGGIVNFEDYAMPVDSLVKQVTRIQEVMDKVMKEGEHYGKIPGTDKPTLLKPGAEKLNLTFRLNPDYEIIREVRERDFIAYTVKCVLNHIPTGQVIASGIGSCNSREAKYRFRFSEELTDVPVPKEYWDARKAGDSKEMKRLLGDGMRARKNEVTGTWVLARAEKVENENPWDLDNTIIKMACKRALVAAVLNGTAASDIFTQDLEDMDPDTVGNQGSGQKKGNGKKDPGSGKPAGGGVKAVKCPETGKFRPETECADCTKTDCKARPRPQQDDVGDFSSEKACPDQMKQVNVSECEVCGKRKGCPAWE